MSDTLPSFEPAEDCPAISGAETRRLLSDPMGVEVEEARQACKSGDVRRASLFIDDLQRDGMKIENLQLCLLDAVESEAHEVIRMLVIAGVPLSKMAIKPALLRNSLRFLSMFTEHGWDINCEEAWCIPPWLSLAIATNPTHSLVS